MLGDDRAINPPSNATYAQYMAQAKLFTGTPADITISLSGQGAYATTTPQVPSPSDIQSNSSLSTTMPGSITTPTGLPSSSSSSSSTRKGIIAGSVVGGVVFLVVLAISISLFLRSNKRKRRGSNDFFRYRAQTPVFNSGPTTETFDRSLFIQSSSNDPQVQALLSAKVESISTPATITPPPPVAHPYTNAASALGHDESFPHPGYIYSKHDGMPYKKPSLPTFHRRPQAASQTAEQTSTQLPSRDQKSPLPVVTVEETNAPNIQLLAREVANVLSAQGHLNVRDGVSRQPSSRDSLRGESPAPPRYRAT
ncbi:hypothetical protein H0H92_013855 [Tricholoma furcatifolium]|nr:hypothetical protein H0H92_013855 [Tricholoma furcatifolium]